MYSIDLICHIRDQFEKLLEDTSQDELNTIPRGFSNNIAWNYGHIIVSGYALAFISSGVNPSFPVPMYGTFRKGSKPEALITREEIDSLTELRRQFPAALEEAIHQNRFTDITPYTTQTFGVPMTTLDSILTTIAAHDTLHLQTAKMYKRILYS